MYGAFYCVCCGSSPASCHAICIYWRGKCTDFMESIRKKQQIAQITVGGLPVSIKNVHKQLNTICWINLLMMLHFSYIIFLFKFFNYYYVIPIWYRNLIYLLRVHFSNQNNKHSLLLTKYFKNSNIIEK